ncbi:major facilitator superfamily domain-containing protein [Mycena amicta]|nr:major facilitator superfamily domain-containing protein [Mycena amicta]
MSNTTPASPLQVVQSEEKPPRNARFWLIFLCLCVCSFVTALELGAMSAALPTIVGSLHGSQFIWAGSAYSLGATALIPLSGGLAQIFGRRPVMLGAIILFGVGSAVCGAAREINMLIAGRTIQGLGGGGIISLTQIIIADLVSLRERGSFNGLISVTYSVGIGIGPVVGGSLAATGQWRWLFYLNLPICGLAGILVILFLRLPTPPGTLWEKMARIDYVGNMIVIAATTAIVLGLTWGGTQFSWGSRQVLISLLLGLFGLVIFVLYESRFAKHPMVPFSVLSTRTGQSGYAQTFINSTVMLVLNYYIQVFFQGCYNVSATGGGVDSLPVGFLAAPFGLIAGIIIQKTNAYRIPMNVGWMFLIVGFGLLSTVNADTGRARVIGYTVICGVGIGTLVLSTYFPVLAPLSVAQNTQALALLIFVRNMSYVWGVAIGGTILQNQLISHLPADFVSKFPGGVAIAYSIIPVIRTLEEPLRTQVRVAFADSLKVVWWTATGISGLGLCTGLLMKHYPLHTSVDEKWGLDKVEMKRDTSEDGQSADKEELTSSPV